MFLSIGNFIIIYASNKKNSMKSIYLVLVIFIGNYCNGQITANVIIQPSCVWGGLLFFDFEDAVENLRKQLKSNWRVEVR